MINITGIKGIPEIKPGDDLASLIVAAILKQGIKIADRDILVIAQKIVSKAEGRLVDLKSIRPSKFALRIAEEKDKDPRIVEIVLQESIRIVKMDRGIIIAETKHGFICANAGVDKSNIKDDKVSLLPTNPDDSAKKLRDDIMKITKKEIVVIISDTFGRPWRKGQINVAIGVSGLEPILNYKYKKDMYGNILKVTSIAVADELASAAELVMGKIDGIPVAVISGYKYKKDIGFACELVRTQDEDLFR